MRGTASKDGGTGGVCARQGDPGKVWTIVPEGRQSGGQMGAWAAPTAPPASSPGRGTQPHRLNPRIPGRPKWFLGLCPSAQPNGAVPTLPAPPPHLPLPGMQAYGAIYRGHGAGAFTSHFWRNCLELPPSLSFLTDSGQVRATPQSQDPISQYTHGPCFQIINNISHVLHT